MTAASASADAQTGQVPRPQARRVATWSPRSFDMRAGIVIASALALSCTKQEIGRGPASPGGDAASTGGDSAVGDSAGGDTAGGDTAGGDTAGPAGDADSADPCAGI